MSKQSHRSRVNSRVFKFSQTPQLNNRYRCRKDSNSHTVLVFKMFNAEWEVKLIALLFCPAIAGIWYLVSSIEQKFVLRIDQERLRGCDPCVETSDHRLAFVGVPSWTFPLFAFWYNRGHQIQECDFWVTVLLSYSNEIVFASICSKVVIFADLNRYQWTIHFNHEMVVECEFNCKAM